MTSKSKLNIPLVTRLAGLVLLALWAGYTGILDALLSGVLALWLLASLAAGIWLASSAPVWILMDLSFGILLAILSDGVLWWVPPVAAFLGWLTLKASERPPASLENSIVDPDGAQRRLSRMAYELAVEDSPATVLEQALNLGIELVNGEAGPELLGAMLVQSNGVLQCEVARGIPPADTQTPLPLDEGLIATALESGGPMRTAEPASDPGLSRWTSIQGCRSILCIPLAAESDQVGAMLYAHPSAEFFDDLRVALLHNLGRQAEIALRHASRYRDLEREKQRLNEVQEEARKKLARDLHDGPTQTIAAIAMRLNFARRLLQRDLVAAEKELYKVEQAARATSKEMRHMLFTMRPLILESQGLEAALSQLAYRVWDTHKQNVYIEAGHQVGMAMSPNEQAVLFYIAEEAINNATKHAAAQNIWVRLRTSEDHDKIILEVEDDGVGFNVGAVDANYAQRGSLGMVNMRERSELIHGELSLSSREGEGTRIRLIMPQNSRPEESS
jgi:signal transduction histidine kinase